MREIMLTQSRLPVHKREPFLAYFTGESGVVAPSPLRFKTAGEARTISVAFATQRLGWRAADITINDRI